MHPGGRGEIDDRPAAKFAHGAARDLGGEELVLEVERHRAVPILFAHFVRRLALVVGGVVDEHGDRPHALANLLHRRFERGDVGEVALKKQRRRVGGADLGDEVLGRFDGDVDKSHIGLLLGEGLDHRGADARAAAGDEDDLVDERGVAGERHGARPYRFKLKGRDYP